MRSLSEALGQTPGVNDVTEVLEPEVLNDVDLP